MQVNDEINVCSSNVDALRCTGPGVNACFIQGRRNRRIAHSSRTSNAIRLVAAEEPTAPPEIRSRPDVPQKKSPQLLQNSDLSV